MYSVDSSQGFTREYIAPFTTKYAQRISKIHEQRERTEKLKENDVLYARSAIGSTFRVSSADQSKSYNGDRTFGPVRPLSAGRSRSESADRSRSRASSAERFSVNGDASTSSIQRAMSSFDKELQIQKDIAAKEKQKLALLQVKKESYINYLKNKGNTPWIPGGQGAKHESSLHKSVNKSAAEQRMLQRAWCRSPWPGQLPKNVNTEAETEPFKFNDSYDVRDEDNDFQLQSPVGKLYDRISSPQRSPVPIAPRYCTSPQRLPARAHVGQQQQLQAPPLPAATPANMRSPSGGDSYSVSSTQNSRASTANARKNRSSSAGTGTVGKGSSSDGNSKYVALTVRLIQAAQSHRSAYGVFIVPRNCTRLEMIANLERQFNVHNQVSDISITYRTGYSHGVTIKSLSMGTIADVPQLDDYSSITVFLGGSTIFDSAGNIITHSEKGDVTAPYVSHTDLPSSLSPSPAVVVGAGVGNGKSVSPMMTVLTKGGIHGRSSGNIYDHSNHYTLQRSPSQGFLNPASTSASTIATTSAAAMTRGLSTGDNLLYFDDNTSVNSDDASSTYSRASKVSRLSQLVPPAPSTGNILPYGATATTTSAATFTAAARNASQGKSGNGINRPVPVPMYENLHPEQPMHGFSYISPAQPLLADSLAAAVLTSVNDPHSAEFNDAATALTATSGGTGAGHTGGGGVTGKSVAAAAGTNSSVAGASSRGLSRGYSTRSLLAQQQQQQLQSQRTLSTNQSMNNFSRQSEPQSQEHRYQTFGGSSSSSGGDDHGGRMLAEELLDLDMDVNSRHPQHYLENEEGDGARGGIMGTGETEGSSGARYHESSLRRSILEKKSSFRDRTALNSTGISQQGQQGGNPAGTNKHGNAVRGNAVYPSAAASYLFGDEPVPPSPVPVQDYPEAADGGNSMNRSSSNKSSGGNAPGGGGGSGRQSHSHAPRDWLAEAEAQLRLEHQRTQQQRMQQVKGSQEQQQHDDYYNNEGDLYAALDQQEDERERDGGEGGEYGLERNEQEFEGVYSSPAYRGATTSSALRRRDRVDSFSSAPAADPTGRGRDRGRSRERTNSSGALSIGSTSVGGSFRSGSGQQQQQQQQRSRSADPTSSRSRSQSASRLLFPPPSAPAAPFPAGYIPPLVPRSIRTTASSRGREAFNSSRASLFDEVNHNIYSNREGVAAGGYSNIPSSPLAGRGRSSSTGSLQRRRSFSAGGSTSSRTRGGAVQYQNPQQRQQQAQRQFWQEEHQQQGRRRESESAESEDPDTFLHQQEQQHNFLLGHKVFSRSSEELDYLGQELSSLSPVLPPHLIPASGGYRGAPLRQAYVPSSSSAQAGAIDSSPGSQDSVFAGEGNSAPADLHQQSQYQQQHQHLQLPVSSWDRAAAAAADSTQAGTKAGVGSSRPGRGRSSSRQISMNLDDLLADLE